LWALLALCLAWLGGAAWFSNRLYYRIRAAPKEYSEKLSWFVCTGCEQVFSAYPKHLKIAILLHNELACTARDEEDAA